MHPMSETNVQGGLRRGREGGDAKQLGSDARQLKWSGAMSSPRTFLLCAPAELSPLPPRVALLHSLETASSSRCRRQFEIHFFGNLSSKPFMCLFYNYLLPPPDEEDGDAGDEHCGADEGGGGDGGDLAAGVVFSSVAAARDAAAVPEEGGGVERVSEGGLQVKGKKMRLLHQRALCACDIYRYSYFETMPRLKDIKDPYRNESSNNIGRKQHPPLNEASSISPHGRHSLSLVLFPSSPT